VLSLASAVIVAGTLVNAFARNCAWLIVAQVLTGVGSGTLGVTRAFVSERTSGNERTYKMARLTAVQYTGFTVTPFIGSLFSWLLGDADFMIGPFRVTAYTCAAYFLTALSVACWLALNSCFVDYVPARDRPHSPTSLLAGAPPTAGSVAPPALPSSAGGRGDMDFRSVGAWTEVDWCIFAGLVLNVCTKGSVGVYETMGIPLATAHFGVSNEIAGFTVSACGAAGVLALAFLMKPLVERFHDTKLMVGGVFVMIASCGFMVNYSSDGSTSSKWQYFLGIFTMYASGYPIGHTAVLTWYSKLSKQAAQGFLQGWFGSAGSVGRILLPAVSGIISECYGDNALFVCLGAFVFLTWLAIVANFDRFYRLTKG
jgi:ceroid-lipofuscinosis MFS transporter 7